MPSSEAQKRATAKWDKQHMTNVAVRLTKEKAQQFAEACQALGVTRSQVLKAAIDKAIADSVKTGDSD